MTASHQIIETDIHLLKLNRPLSGRWAGEMEQTFIDVFKRGARRVIVNLEDVPYIDGRGLAALLTGLEALNGDAQSLQLVAPQTQPQLLFELTGFDKIFSIVDAPHDVVV